MEERCGWLLDSLREWEQLQEQGHGWSHWAGQRLRAQMEGIAPEPDRSEVAQLGGSETPHNFFPPWEESRKEEQEESGLLWLGPISGSRA